MDQEPDPTRQQGHKLRDTLNFDAKEPATHPGGIVSTQGDGRKIEAQQAEFDSVRDGPEIPLDCGGKLGEPGATDLKAKVHDLEEEQVGGKADGDSVLWEDTVGGEHLGGFVGGFWMVVQHVEEADPEGRSQALRIGRWFDKVKGRESIIIVRIGKIGGGGCKCRRSCSFRAVAQ